MIEFWISACVLAGIALIWILPSLLRPPRHNAADQYSQNISIAQQKLKQLDTARESGELDAAAFESLRSEVEQSLALDVTNLEKTTEESAGGESSRPQFLPLLITFLLPVAAGAIYLSLGEPSAITGVATQSAASGGNAPNRQPSVDEMMAQLKQRLKENPDDLRGWTILARSSMSLQKFEDAAKAFERVNQLSPNDPDILVQYADALAMVAGGALNGESLKLLNQALSIDPNQPQGLWLAGMAADQRSEFQLALNHWNRLLPQLDDDPQSKSELQGLIENMMERARSNGIELDTNAVQADTSPAATPSAAAAIRVSVDVAPTMRDRINPQDTVFVFAQAISGPPMPLAAAKRTVAELPFEVVLDDQSAMMPDLKLSSAERVNVVARISTSGRPTASPGDIQGRIPGVAPKNSPSLSIMIDTVIE